ncbi:MAG: acetyltransferase [Rhodobacteraceae bacterium PARR1]|nr:MAG: acetyltransferase [Rhodobacteraceae bacterium PARR1]
MTHMIGIYGASGCGRGIMPLARAEFPAADLVFIDDGLGAAVVNGHPVLPWEAFLARNAPTRSVAIAIADSTIRERLAQRAMMAGVPLQAIRAATVVEMDDVQIAEGACLSPFVTLTSNIRIGKCFHANLYSYVEHDCLIGDFVTLAPGAKVNGAVTLGDHVYIGSGAVIRQGLTIGEGAVVGMGAVVTRDVPAGVTVVGNPARVMERSS